MFADEHVFEGQGREIQTIVLSKLFDRDHFSFLIVTALSP